MPAMFPAASITLYVITTIVYTQGVESIIVQEPGAPISPFKQRYTRHQQHGYQTLGRYSRKSPQGKPALKEYNPVRGFNPINSHTTETETFDFPGERAISW
ncbi:uncharacterized protein BJX67DRAFT_304731 [Aspergillus lucknowensis]|uniref:Secreted protein n=1 Tax=Aspergillus lucknowensis TaxID=176173 RepID=A0ABR4M2R5_9EURO